MKVYLVCDVDFDRFEVLAVFANREDAERVNREGLGDIVEEAEFFPAGQRPEKVTVYKACSETFELYTPQTIDGWRVRLADEKAWSHRLNGLNLDQVSRSFVRNGRPRLYEVYSLDRATARRLLREAMEKDGIECS